VADLDRLYGVLDRAIERGDISEAEARAEWFEAEAEAARESAEREMQEWGESR
jgi:hypothetical protein